MAVPSIKDGARMYPLAGLFRAIVKYTLKGSDPARCAGGNLTRMPSSSGKGSGR